MSQGSMSLLDISISDDEDTHKCKVHELARKSDTDFEVWKHKLISNRMTGLKERDNMVNDYADGGKRKPKNPDFFGPLSLIWRNVEFLSRYPPQRILGVMSFLPHGSNDCIYSYTSKTAS